MRGEVREDHAAVNVAELVEQWGAKAAIAKAPTKPFHGLIRIATLVIAFDHAAQAFGCDVGGNGLIHLDEDEAAVASVFFVVRQHPMAGSA